MIVGVVVVIAAGIDHNEHFIEIIAIHKIPAVTAFNFCQNSPAVIVVTCRYASGDLFNSSAEGIIGVLRLFNVYLVTNKLLVILDEYEHILHIYIHLD